MEEGEAIRRDMQENTKTLMNYMAELSLKPTKAQEATAEKMTSRLDSMEETCTDLVKRMETLENKIM